MSTKVPIGAEELWKVIGGFNALPDWHPGIEKSELEDGGSVRRLSLAGGITVVEKLIDSNDSQRTYTYKIENAPLPVANYVATLKVRQNEDGSTSTVDWSGEFEPLGPEAEAIATIQGVYQAGFDNLKKMFGG